MSTTALYRQHLETLDRHLADALERAGRLGVSLDGVLFHAGRTQTYHADDEEIPFHATPHFRRWVPLEGPEHAVLARPGKRPLVVRVQPRDFWIDTSPPPPSYWEDNVELAEVESFDEVASSAGSLEGVAYVGNSPEAAAELGIAAELVEPAELLRPLDWYRSYKTDHEVDLLTTAARKAATGHRQARAAFEGGGSEREVYWAYLRGSDQVERELPFGTIAAFGHKGSILHYQHKRGPEAAPAVNLLMDAGASWQGYAADITRTWARPGADSTYLALLSGLDSLQQELVGRITPGLHFTELHLDAHRRVAELLAGAGVLKGSAEEALERGVTGTFLPHGLGHHLGIQVHDVGGRQRDPDGGEVPPPEGHPFLRNTRILEPGHFVTIEPGIYFTPLLLEPLRSGGDAELVDWSVVDRLIPYGGIRIEDDVLCTEGGHRDLTRPHIEGPRGT